MDPLAGDEIIQFFGTKMLKSVFLLYEQTELDDRFGRQMLSNLAQRSIYLPSLEKYPDRESLEKRFLTLGWDTIESKLMTEIYDSISESQQKIINQLEWLDEIEEWNLLQTHWVFCVAKRSKE
eukprot:GHVP01022436.1.p1 GENE.GHVP01022436.1~~GHVP01022436.1.p1  ORF type:complete len:123 (+),score=27.03 GHVP01022436.1:356-724(+)